jgi:hypothetical protein
MARDERLELDADILFRAVGDDGVVVDQRGPTVMVVNAVALRVLELIREGAVASAFAARLAEEFDAEPGRIAADVEQFLDELKNRAMLR